MDLKSKIREISDFPMKGIQFKDITTLLKDKAAFKFLIDEMAGYLQDKNIDMVVGPEARGFVVGAPVAYVVGAGFLPTRKKGKLPAEAIQVEYGLEYGKNIMEIHKDALAPGMRVAVVDDLLATGGTAKAACELVEKCGAKVEAILFAIELGFLNGRETLKGYDVKTFIEY
jgi:adenine phosphoribosyltransferase